jgi:hypothetical protein
MALFTDGLISSVEELMSYESAILDTAKTESIDLTAKLKLAEEELSVELQAFLARHRINPVWAGLWQTQSQLRSVGNVVVTDALHKWHTFRTLALTFRDAYYNQLNDRYQGKWQEYEQLAARALNLLFDTGVGITNAPVPRAAQPELTTVAGQCGAATYFVSVTWIGPAGVEGAPSDLAAITAADSTALSVKAVNPPAGATGWNVYVGNTGDDLMLQNSSPLALSDTWMESGSGIAAGVNPGNGQGPDFHLHQSTRRVIDRG